MADAHTSFTQNGMPSKFVQCPVASKAKVITPIVFCASLVPWARETSVAVPIWPHRNPALRNRAATPTVTR
jgi:hypothetical protein